MNPNLPIMRSFAVAPNTSLAQFRAPLIAIRGVTATLDGTILLVTECAPIPGSTGSGLILPPGARPSLDANYPAFNIFVVREGQSIPEPRAVMSTRPEAGGARGQLAALYAGSVITTGGAAAVYVMPVELPEGMVDAHELVPANG